jgi:hypothetical protein
VFCHKSKVPWGKKEHLMRAVIEIYISGHQLIRVEDQLINYLDELMG